MKPLIFGLIATFGLVLAVSAGAAPFIPSSHWSVVQSDQMISQARGHGHAYGHNRGNRGRHMGWTRGRRSGGEHGRRD